GEAALAGLRRTRGRVDGTTLPRTAAIMLGRHHPDFLGQAGGDAFQQHQPRRAEAVVVGQQDPLEQIVAHDLSPCWAMRQPASAKALARLPTSRASALAAFPASARAYTPCTMAASRNRENAKNTCQSGMLSRPTRLQ